MLGIETAAARQRYHRARRKLDSDGGGVTPNGEQKRLLEQMISTVSAGDAHGLVALMAEDAVLLTDGGGKVSAALQPIADPRRIARVLVHLAGQKAVADLRPVLLPVNGGVALVLEGDGLIHSCVLVEARQGLIRRIYVVRNPDKLGDLAVAGRARTDATG
jgi:RNA polymerase sigma-70 factor (ECF subfamily)